MHIVIMVTLRGSLLYDLWAATLTWLGEVQPLADSTYPKMLNLLALKSIHLTLVFTQRHPSTSSDNEESSTSPKIPKKGRQNLRRILKTRSQNLRKQSGRVRERARKDGEGDGGKQSPQIKDDVEAQKDETEKDKTEKDETEKDETEKDDGKHNDESDKETESEGPSTKRRSGGKVGESSKGPSPPVNRILAYRSKAAPSSLNDRDREHFFVDSERSVLDEVRERTKEEWKMIENIW
jgi:hypothetical protein